MYNIRQPDSAIYDHYVGTGIVTDYYRTDRYIVQVKDVPYVLRTTDRFHIGDEIFFQAYNSPKYKGGLQRYNNGRLQSFSGGYTFDYAKWQHMRGFAGTLYSTQSVVVGHTDLSLRQQIRQWLHKRIATNETSVTAAIMLGILL